jgi:hypothetical protein
MITVSRKPNLRLAAMRGRACRQATGREAGGAEEVIRQLERKGRRICAPPRQGTRTGRKLALLPKRMVHKVLQSQYTQTHLDHGKGRRAASLALRLNGSIRQAACHPALPEEGLAIKPSRDRPTPSMPLLAPEERAWPFAGSIPILCESKFHCIFRYLPYQHSIMVRQHRQALALFARVFGSIHLPPALLTAPCFFIV